MFSKFFIERPIFATVIAVIMVLAGAMCYFTLPVAQYPDITPPTVMVTASYPGASATTVAQTVGVPIEQQVNGVEGMLYMSSNSGSDGSYSLTITFKNGTDLDQAAVDVQNRISLISSTLPTEVSQQGVSVNKEASNQIMFVALLADDPERYDALYLTNYAELNLINPLSRVDGVGGVQAFGGGNYSMRIWLDPEAMRIRNLTPSDISAAIQSQNIEVSAGSVGQPPLDANTAFEYTLVSKGRLSSPEEFGNIVIKTDGTEMLRLKDVATIDLGSSSYSNSSTINGISGCAIGINQLPGANALDVAKGCEEELNRLSQYLPDGVHFSIIMNATDYVKESVHDLFMTFLLTSLIVMIVILIFLQNWRAVVIPMITIPVSLIATFAVMKIMGFSLNTLSLFGLVLAIAIVVDDAIVVVEDCSRLVDEGSMTRHQAAEKAMQELTGPVVGEVLVLLSVFIPTAFVSGITGQLYKQFALTIAVSTAFSGFNALTLTPALCALFLKPRKQSNFFIYRWFNYGWKKFEGLYDKVVDVMLKHAAISLIVFLLLAGVAFWGFMKWPTSYIPSEDMGYYITSVQLPTGASLERTEKVTNQLAAEIKKIPGVKDVMTISGFSIMGGGAASNAATVMVMLEPWKDRGRSESVDVIIEKTDEIGSKIQSASIFAVNPPAIPGLGMSAGLELNLLDINSLGATEMLKAIDQLRIAVDKDPRFSSLTTMYQGVVPQYQLNVDRNKAKSMGITLSDIYTTLSGYMGGNYVNDFVEFDRVYQVRLQGDMESRENIEDVLRLSVRNSAGEMVPFTSFASLEPVMGQATVNRYNMYESASVTVTPAKGVSSSEGIEAMEELVKETLGKNYSYAWTGMAYQETQSGTTITFVFIFAIIMTILVLAAQYESWTDPIAVILATPIAILGTVLGCLCMNQSISVYTQIGLILLIGMSAKNAILIVEYAMDFRKQGQPIMQAAHDAGVIRFRPIMMTALAFVFGVMPMMFATGAGANSRIELGTAVVFGMAMNAFIGTLFVPTFWDFMQRLNEKYLSGLFKDPAPANPPKNPNPDSI
ncbi:MAG: efflux RND transporter permease subunit [Muribaculum sp.]|nr:efflux RND transporter permease subunit [Muribaculum sp.]